MPRQALKLSAVNSPDPGVVADAAIALLLDFHAKTSRQEQDSEATASVEVPPPTNEGQEP